MNESLLLLAETLWRPVLPIAVIGLIFVVAAAALLFSYLRLPAVAWWRRILLAILRLAAISVLAIIMLGPSRMIDTPTSNRNGRLFVLADVSESMLTENPDGTTRLEQMQNGWLSESAIDRLQTEVDVEPYQFAEQPKTIPNIGENLSAVIGENTHLVQSCIQLISRIEASPGSTLLLLSDGIDSEDASINRVGLAAKAKKLEIHTVAFGDKTSRPDAAVLATPMQEYLFPKETGSILARIYQVGCRGKQSVLTVTQGKNKLTFPIDFSNRDYAEVKIPVRHEEMGQYEYQYSLATLPGEKETGNNLQTVFVTVQPRRMQVLLLEGSPNWDAKFIAQSLRKDSRIALTQLAQITSDRKVTIITRGDEELAAFRVPESPEEWGKFDVVLLGKQVENVLSETSAESLVQQFRQAGINIVFARGRPCDPETASGRRIGALLAPIEPVTWGGDRIAPGPISLTSTGKVVQWFSPT